MREGLTWAFLPRGQGSAATPRDPTASGHVHTCPSLRPGLCLFQLPLDRECLPSLLQGWEGSL